MKKLFGIFVILFITTGVFGQKFIRDLSFIEPTPYKLSTIETAINSDRVFDNYDWIHVVHFIKDDRLYLLSYEPVEDCNNPECRSIYLYSKDLIDVTKAWEQASDVIMTNHWESSWDYSDVDFYMYDEKQHNTSVGKVVEDDDGHIIMTIDYYAYVNGRRSISEPVTIIFTPVGNNKYAHKWQK